MVAPKSFLGVHVAWIALAALLSGAGGDSGAPSGQPAAGTANGLIELERALSGALQRGERAGLGELLADDFELHTAHTPVEGKDRFVERASEQAKLLVSVEGEQIEARVLGNLGVITGWRRTFVLYPGADGLVDRQAFFHVARRVGEKWKLVMAFEAPDPG
jgi:hypothetical protein